MNAVGAAEAPEARAREAVSQSHETAAFKWVRSEAARAYQAPEAFLCVLSLAATADHSVAVLESEWLQTLTRRWWERGVVAQEDLEALNFAVCTRLGEDRDAALGRACAALPPACRLPVFAQALDLMLMNGSLNSAEAEFAGVLVRSLQINAADAERMRECIITKHAY